MRTSSALLRRACVPVLSLGLLTLGLFVPVAHADTETPAAPVEGAKSESSAVAEAADTSKDVVVEAATTPTALTVAHPDGTLTTTMSTDPVRMQTSTGWADISTDLVRATVDGVSVLKPENVPVDITVGTGGTDKIASLDDKNGHSLTQSWPFGTLPEPVVEGNSATFRQVLPGVDLIQLVHKTGISQVLKIETAEAAKDPRVAEMRIFLDSQNTVVEQNADGDLTAKGTDSGEVEMRNTGGLWWDSSAQGATATDPGGQGIARPFSLSLGTESGKQSQIFGMDEILDTAALKFPVYVDPDWTASRANYVFVDSAYPETSYWNGNLTNGQGHVGYLPSYWAPDGVSHLARTYFQFNTSYLVGRDILAARLNTVETWSSSCTPANVASWITGDIGAATRWNVQPGLIMRTDMGAVAKGYNASCPAGTVGFDLMAAKSILLNRTVWNVMLAAGNESDPLGWKKFENSATLTVTHNLPPNTPVIGTITGGKYAYPQGAPAYYVTRNPKPIFRVSDSDPDGAVGGPIQVYMEVYTSTGALVRGSSGISGAAAGDQFDWQIDVTLPDGKYYLQSQSKDLWGAYSGTMRFNFVVDSTPPAAPTITEIGTTQNPVKLTVPDPDEPDEYRHDDGVIGSTIYSFRLALPAGSEPVEGFVFSITSGAAESSYPQSIRCGDSRIQAYVAVCPAGGMSADISIAALDDTTSLTVWAFDSAGNVTVPLHNAAASHITFSVGKGSVTPSTFMPLTFKGSQGVQWAPVGSSGATNSCTSTPNGNTVSTPEMLKFTNTTSWAETTGPAVDPAKSFSVSGWFCPTTSTTSIQDLIVQWAGTNPAGALRINEVKPELAAWATDGSGEAVSGDTLLPVGQWSFISAVYDKINAQLRVTRTNTNTTGTWIIAASQKTHRSATASTDVVKLGYGFTGNIFKPVMTQGVLKPETFTNAQAKFTDTTKGLLK
ncbi:hypothetical protein ACFRJ9_07085 [Paenarthrobacter sp. NPDC056912]|uniref:hypothetical protein n=1 Tax=Paenarthrobacter sp. NPDC056912 TaxID=3345965 RepID=UPI00367354B0